MHLGLQSSKRLHVAIIMDGNGRWATERGLPRSAGHRAGVQALRRVVEMAPSRGIGTLSLFAFSADNWRRPPQEVRTLMALMREYLHKETRRCVEEGIQLTVLGRRERLDPELRAAVAEAEAATAGGRNLSLRIALNYSSRDAILAAAARLRPGRIRKRRDFASLLAGVGERTAPDVDLLIRTGGEKRLSDFLLWESAYAELHFTDVHWPEFTVEDLDAALRDFSGRDRRYGNVKSLDAEVGVTAATGGTASACDSWLD